MAQSDPKLSTISLLVVAFIVFAPAPRAIHDTGSDSSGGAGIAAQMLAPTVDQGLAGERAAVAKRVWKERDKRNSGHVSPAALRVALCLFVASTLVIGLRPPRTSCYERVSSVPARRRAPPRLRPA